MESFSEISAMGFPQILLEIGPEDSQNPDPTAIQQVSRQMIKDLKQDGDTVAPVYQGQRGGFETLFQVGITDVQTLGTAIMAHKDAFDVVVALCTIFTSVRSLVTHLLHSEDKSQPQTHDVKVSITIGDGSIELTSSNLADDERVKQLADHFLRTYPGIKITAHSPVKVKGRVSARRKH